jgi:hypothetical protein
MRKPRKNYTTVEKVAILRRHLIDRVPVSDLFPSQVAVSDISVSPFGMMAAGPRPHYQHHT